MLQSTFDSLQCYLRECFSYARLCFFSRLQDVDSQRDKRASRKFVPTAEGIGGVVSDDIVVMTVCVEIIFDICDP